MKRIKLVICFLLVLLSMQLNARDKNDLDSMINVSILEYVKNRNISIKRGNILGKIDDFSNYYILTKGIPDEFKFNSEVKSKGFKAVSDLFGQKKLFRKGKSVLKLVGPIIEKDKIIIIFNGFFVKSKYKFFGFSRREHIHNEYGSSMIFTWKYSQKNKNWELIDIKEIGI